MDLQNASRIAAASVKNFFSADEYLVKNHGRRSLDIRIFVALWKFGHVFYPVLVIVAIPVNIVTIVILSRGKCGLSKGVTRYLVAMVATDQLVLLFDVLLSKIPLTYFSLDIFYWSLGFPVCNVHTVVLYAATDCSVWFTVTFTFDRFIAICFQKLKRKYCTGRAAALVLGTITVLSIVKNIFWYLMLSGQYFASIFVVLCFRSTRFFALPQISTFKLIHFFLTPILPFVLILLLNSLTIRHVLLSSRARRRLHVSRDGETHVDPEMKNRRQSLLLLMVMSGNFILLWALLTVCSVWESVDYSAVAISSFALLELRYMPQLLSCCTNTALYAVAQTRFRLQFKETVKSPFRLMRKFTRRLSKEH